MLDWLRCTVTHSSVGDAVADPDGEGEELADGLLVTWASSVAVAVAVAGRSGDDEVDAVAGRSGDDDADGVAE